MLMENKIRNLTGSRSDACTTVGANCCVNESDSKSRGYVGGGSVLATLRLYTQVYEFRPLSEEVTALRLGASEALLIGVLSYRGANPCARGEGWLI